MKIVSIVGARPQFIKYAILAKELRKIHKDVLVHTGQHYDYNMNKIFFDQLNIPNPDYHLGVGSGTQAYQTAEIMKGVEDIVINEKPDVVMLYGDTNSTIAGALAAVKIHVPIAHVESGLRSFDRSIPEEINRIVTDHCSDYLFCPTQTALDNLKREGITIGVYLTGDVMVDALNFYKEIAEESNILSLLGLTSKKYILVTVHRVSNTEVRDNLKNIVESLIKLSNMGETIVFPIHPRTERSLKAIKLYDELKVKVRLVEPLGYFEFLKLLNHTHKVLTDSGGIQKEAYILKVPCITMRQNTEWIETIEDGWNVLAGTDTEQIIELVQTFMPTHSYSSMFGKGACGKISTILSNKIN
jgi:UDP-N-acetylglucosamine 2-epimerase